VYSFEMSGGELISFWRMEIGSKWTGLEVSIEGLSPKSVTTLNNVSELSLYSHSALSETLLSTVVD
jgi:hypothetical protein